MLSNDELLALVRNSDKRESWRKEALDKLIANLAVDNLYRIVLDTDRYESWRKKALDAICETATLRGAGFTVSSLALSVAGSSIVVNSAAISIGIPAVADRAADILYKMVNDTDRYERWRYQCLQYLIRIGHKEYLKRIADNTDRYDKWRNEAMNALIHG